MAIALSLSRFLLYKLFRLSAPLFARADQSLFNCTMRHYREKKNNGKMRREEEQKAKAGSLEVFANTISAQPPIFSSSSLQIVFGFTFVTTFLFPIFNLLWLHVVSVFVRLRRASCSLFYVPSCARPRTFSKI